MLARVRRFPESLRRRVASTPGQAARKDVDVGEDADAADPDSASTAKIRGGGATTISASPTSLTPLAPAWRQLVTSSALWYPAAYCHNGNRAPLNLPRSCHPDRHAKFTDRVAPGKCCPKNRCHRYLRSISPSCSPGTPFVLARCRMLCFRRSSGCRSAGSHIGCLGSQNTKLIPIN